MIDDEHKITEFDYENYFSKEALEGVDTKSAEFRMLVKALNFCSATEHEQLQNAKENFKEMMPVLRSLSKDEARTFMHKLRNTPRDPIVQSLMSKEVEIKLAKLSEDENFNLKNRYRHQRQTMDYADRKRMPIDESKVVDLLRNQGEFRERMDNEIGTYSTNE